MDRHWSASSPVMDETGDAKDEPMMLMLAAMLISMTMMTALAPIMCEHAATAKSGKRNKTERNAAHRKMQIRTLRCDEMID